MMARLRRFVTAQPALLGLFGAVLILLGSSWYQALVTPPYRFIDEQAHVGYILAIQDGQLPTIDTPINQAEGGRALRERLAAEPENRRDVWVANNPPLTYVVAAGPAALTRSLGVSGGPLLGLRLVNLTAVAGAVFLSYLLARDLAGGDRSVGLVAAGLVAATPHLGFVASLAFNDGVALFATTGVLWALARVARAGVGEVDGRRAIAVLGCWCAVAAATRPMALVVAAVAGALGLALTWWRRSAGPVWALAWAALPTLITSAWFYALNVHRYGDPTGSSALFEKFGRQPGAPLPTVLQTKGIWESAFRTITTRRMELSLPSDPYLWYQVALGVAAFGVVATIVLVTISGIRHRGTRSDQDLPILSWVAVGVVALVPILLTAQHRAGGGSSHPRYLLPMLPVIAAAIALAVVRLATRWTGAALVVVVFAMMIRQTRTSARWLADNPTGPAGSDLATAYGSDLVQNAGLVVAGVGLLLLLVGIGAWQPRET